jgi:hypothetical protein
MTAPSKARQIINEYFHKCQEWFPPQTINGWGKVNYRACELALIAVDEVIEQWDYLDTYLGDGNGELNPNLKYWYDVQKYIKTEQQKHYEYRNND